MGAQVTSALVALKCQRVRQAINQSTTRFAQFFSTMQPALVSCGLLAGMMLQSNGTDSRQWPDSQTSSCTARWAKPAEGGCDSTKGGVCGLLEKPRMPASRTDIASRKRAAPTRVRRRVAFATKADVNKAGNGTRNETQNRSENSSDFECTFNEQRFVEDVSLSARYAGVVQPASGESWSHFGPTLGSQHRSPIPTQSPAMGMPRTRLAKEPLLDTFQGVELRARESIPISPFEVLPNGNNLEAEEDPDYLPWTPAERRFVEKNYVGVMRLTLASSRFGPVALLIVLFLIGLPLLMAARLLWRLL